MEFRHFVSFTFFMCSVWNTKSQFYEVIEEPDITDVNGEFCEDSWRCQKQSSIFDADIFPKNCRCDSSCDIYGDCCPDRQGQDTSSSMSKHPDTYPEFQCLYLQSIETAFMINIINKCPENSQNDLKYLCENQNKTDLIYKTPVTGKRTGFLYRNSYCALCNNENYYFWTSAIDCKWKYQYEGTYKTEDLLKQKECQIVFEKPFPSVTVRQCVQAVDTCTPQYMEYSDGCYRGGYALVFTTDQAYKNRDCAKCNGEAETNLTCSITNTSILPKGKRLRYNYSYRVLFDLNSLNGRTIRKNREMIVNETERDFYNICNASQVYDPFTESCENIHCIPPLVYKDKKCLLVESDVESDNSTTPKLCPSRRFDESEYRIINGSRIQILSSQKTFEKFYVLNSTAYVCIETTRSEIVREGLTLNSTVGERILTLVSQIISIISLFVGLVVYITSPKLHNIPGKNLISLMASLFVAQITFLLAPFFEARHAWCYAVAVVVHLAFLASFFWMNVMSFDVFYTFSRGFLKSGEKGRSSKRFRYYSAYGWSMPVLVVLTSVCVDLLTKSEYAAKYGESLCWITNSEGLLVFFLIPLSILLFANILFFITAARNIYVSDKNTSKILKRRETCKLFIYLKLSVVMGLTWVFGFIATLANNNVLWYLFIIFNALQGVFVFVAFVCTKKVCNLVRDNVSSLYSSTRSYYLSTRSRSTSTAKSTEELYQSKFRARTGESNV